MEVAIGRTGDEAGDDRDQPAGAAPDLHVRGLEAGRGANEDDGAVAECLHGILRYTHAALGRASACEDTRLDELARDKRAAARTRHD